MDCLFLPWNFNCLFTSRSFKERLFLLKYKSTVSHSPIEWAYYMLLALESQICVVIVLQKEFNRTMTWRGSTELSCLCVKPVWGTKSQYLNEILSKTDKTWTWCCIIASSHICWINFEQGVFSRKQQHNVLQTLFRKNKKKIYLPTYPYLNLWVGFGQTEIFLMVALSFDSHGVIYIYIYMDSIKELTLILKIICQCDVKSIMMSVWCQEH